MQAGIQILEYMCLRYSHMQYALKLDLVFSMHLFPDLYTVYSGAVIYQSPSPTSPLTGSWLSTLLFVPGSVLLITATDYSALGSTVTCLTGLYHL